MLTPYIASIIIFFIISFFGVLKFNQNWITSEILLLFPFSCIFTYIAEAIYLPFYLYLHIYKNIQLKYWYVFASAFIIVFTLNAIVWGQRFNITSIIENNSWFIPLLMFSVAFSASIIFWLIAPKQYKAK
jgi:hypothetical protein